MIALYPQPAYEMTAEDRAEEARERDSQRAARYKSDLAKLPSFLGEICLNDEENIAACAALNAGDDKRFADIWRACLAREIDTAVEDRAERTGYTLAEAAEHLCLLHKDDADMARRAA